MVNDIKNTTLILGNGFLGKEFVRHGYTHYTTSEMLRYITFSESIEEDIESHIKFLSKLEYILDELAIHKNIKIDTIINCIGKADTRYCEDEINFMNDVIHVNGGIPNLLSNFCRERNLKFVQISTGCLYDIRTRPAKETDFTAAHCKYVISKWIGELGCDKRYDLIIRPRLYFSDIDNKFNLITKFKRFNTILNEFNSVVSTRTIVEAVTSLLENNQSGIFNVANDGAYTIKQLSEAIGYTWSDDQVVHQEELHKSQGLYLVNNVMDLTKLKQFYTPRDAISEIKWCAENFC